MFNNVVLREEVTLLTLCREQWLYSGQGWDYGEFSKILVVVARFFISDPPWVSVQAQQVK